MTTVLRRLNDRGIRAFAKYIEDVRKGSDAVPPLDLLTDDYFSEDLPWAVTLPHKTLKTRFEMGKFIAKHLAPCSQTHISHDVGLWSWLALFFFDQLCPAISGKRKLSENYTYILSRDYKHHPRHSVRTTYMLVRDYGDKVAFMFSKGLHERGEIVEQLAARQELVACRGVVETAHALYDDPARRTFKRGAASKGKGSVRRFISVLQQFNLTYDLGSLGSGDILPMLPSEFDRFKNTS